MGMFGGRRAGAKDGLAPPRLPAGFEALADALLFPGSAESAAADIATASAAAGAALDELLADIAETYRLVGFGEPSFEVTRSASVAWAEASLRYLHGQSCDDPLTGLASLSHLRSRLAEIYRKAEQLNLNVADTYAIVVVESPEPPESRERQVDKILRMVEVWECIRCVYGGGETLARLTPVRAGVLVERSVDLGETTATLRSLLLDRRLDEDGPDPRVWIEGLPATQDSAISLLDELAR